MGAPPARSRAASTSSIGVKLRPNGASTVQVLPTAARTTASSSNEESCRRLEDPLELHESVARQHLAVQHECLEHGSALAESLGLVAGRQHELAADRENRAALEAVTQRVLHADAEIAGSALPALRRRRDLPARLGP